VEHRRQRQIPLAELGHDRRQFGVATLEASFQQDLNGDGSVAVLTTTIEASGSTVLTQVGNALGWMRPVGWRGHY
jgi:hypothetical protein